MIRLLQAVLFVALLAGVFALAAPVRGDAELLGAVLLGTLTGGTVAYLLPWVYFGRERKPVRAGTDE